MLDNVKLLFLVLVPFTFARAADMEFVRVGNPGNPNDSSGYGYVGYVYRIGKFEVSNDAYAEFLNSAAVDTDEHGLYTPEMGTEPHGGTTRGGLSENYHYFVRPGMGSKPVIGVTFYNALRYCNWLHNGGGASTMTEDGAYTMTAESYPTTTISRNIGAKFWVPNENEWYKAAFHEPGREYWLYPTRTNNPPTNGNPPGDANSANFCCGGVGGLTDVGAYSSAKSYYGTFDQGGNVLEWTETIYSSGRVLRGGCWDCTVDTLRSVHRSPAEATDKSVVHGFRVATWAPNPDCLSLQCRIDAAMPGETVYAGGLWRDTQVVINKDLTLEGSPDATLDAFRLGRPIFIGSNATVNLRNLTLKNGSARNDEENYGEGAGLFISEGAAVTMENCVIENCGPQGQPDYDDYGGGIYNHGTLTLSNCVFRGNRAYIGGGIYNVGNLWAWNSLIVSNLKGGGITGFGNVYMNGCQITGNIAYQWSGGAYFNGTNSMENCLVEGNIGYCAGGGGIWAQDGHLTLRSCIISNNFAGGCTPSDDSVRGGGLKISYFGNVTAYSSTIISNISAYAGMDYTAHDVYGPITLVNSNYIGIVSTNVTITQTVEMSYLRQGFNATLTWPMTAYGNFVIEAHGAVNGSYWLPIEGPYVTTNGNFLMPISIDYGTRFFRLASESP